MTELKRKPSLRNRRNRKKQQPIKDLRNPSSTKLVVLKQAREHLLEEELLDQLARRANFDVQLSVSWVM